MNRPVAKAKRPSRAGAATRTQIMDVAEAIISEAGPDAVSVRDIASRAGVNLAAISYHFGSKENLFKEVVERRILPLNAQRLDLLDRALEAAPDARLHAILNAFLAPLFHLAWDSQYKARVVVVSRFLNDAFSTPEGGRAVISEYYEPVRRAFIRALHGCLPELPLDEVIWRYNSMVGVTLYSLGGIERLAAVPDQLADNAWPTGPENLAQALSRTIHFLEAGFRAPPTRGGS
ncbi:TetR/AcrR family transcriptional regulator [Paracoccus sp. P2]|uniref:TetR/AcrR family transcriptional regulator n=1 Tax=Paracoccus sp. P2 TaxID=3248840 RepID=UPI00391F071E